MNDKYSIATFTGVVVIALALGLLLGKIALAPRAPGPPETGQKMFAAGETKHAKIRLRDKTNRICKAESGGVADAYPHLDPNAQDPPDTIDWSGENEGGNPAKVVVTFPTINPNTGGPGSPFQNNSFGNSDSSGPIIHKIAGDYPFASITVVAVDGTTVTCVNPADPGVHVK